MHIGYLVKTTQHAGFAHENDLMWPFDNVAREKSMGQALFVAETNSENSVICVWAVGGPRCARPMAPEDLKHLDTPSTEFSGASKDAILLWIGENVAEPLKSAA